MSEIHYDVLCNKVGELGQFLEPRDGLLDRMVRDRVFTSADRKLILSKGDVDEMAKKTIDIFQRKPDEAFDKFITALHETGQDHVVYVLTEGITGKLPMSAENREMLLTKTTKLRKFMDPLNGVLDELVSANVISEYDDRRIRRDCCNVTRKLLETLRRKPDDAFDALIVALKATHQKHVTYILTGEGNSLPLNDHFGQRLKETRTQLINTIDSRNTGLISALISKGVFTDYDQQRVRRQPGEPDITQNERILDLIACKSHDSFVNFIAALNETGQEHVSIAIIGADVTAKMIAHCEDGDRNDDTHIFDTELIQYIRKLLDDSDDDKTISKLKQYILAKGIAVLNAKEGCIEIIFTCKDLHSLAELRELQMSSKLDSLFSNTFCSLPFAERGLTSLTVSVSDTEFEKYSKAFADLKLMTSEHREMLKSSEEWLVTELTVSKDLLDNLPLCKQRRQAIESAATREEQVKTLLDIISRQPDAAFTQLLDALDNTRQNVVADKLRQQPTSESLCTCCCIFCRIVRALSREPKGVWALSLTFTQKLPKVFQIF